MSVHQAFRRQPVNPQLALNHQAVTIPAPNRGIIESENQAFLQPGAATIQDNWVSTLRGVKLRGGCIRWSVLPEPAPILSGFDYINANEHKMFVGNATKLYDVTGGGDPILIREGQSGGIYVASQMSNASGNHMLVANEGGNFLLHYDGTTWTTYNSGQITAPKPAPPALPPTCVNGRNLTYVCKYRNRYFFIEGGTMDAWYLGIDAHQGVLSKIPLSGAATKGGRLIFMAVWSIDAGDGTDDKLVFATDQGELLIFTGSNPSDPDNWRQEGRYRTSPPMGMNAHMQVGGDVLIATVDGIIPLSLVIEKEATQLQIAAISYSINSMWRKEVIAKRNWSWTMFKWDEYGACFVTWPGGKPGNQYCGVFNTATLAWSRFVGWDATCFMRMRGNMFFGTQEGVVMQADRSGYDDGKVYTATLVGGWGLFGTNSQSQTWMQARATFQSYSAQPFTPQLSGTVDYVVTVPLPPPAGPDPGVLDAWDQGWWGPDMGGPPPPVPTDQERLRYTQWDQYVPNNFVIRNTMWVSIGMTGYAHAPIVQITVGQAARPNVELISLDCIFSRLGTNI
jgi:hypothetical protein